MVRSPDHFLTETFMTRDLAQKQTRKPLDHTPVDEEKKKRTNKIRTHIHMTKTMTMMIIMT
eukprot:12002579-Prorocentrum_lima.AAC.1